MLPWSMRQRYRASTARRLVRGWVAMINSIGMVISSGLLLVTAALGRRLDSRIVHVCGLRLGTGMCSRDHRPHADSLGIDASHSPLHAESLAGVLDHTCGDASTLFGLIRAWRVWRATQEAWTWVAEAGLAGSMAAGAVALGYYLIFWAGVWIRSKKHRRETAATPPPERLSHCPIRRSILHKRLHRVNVDQPPTLPAQLSQNPRNPQPSAVPTRAVERRNSE